MVKYIKILEMEEYFMWEESYKIGVKLIDKQHKELFRMVDELMKAVEQNASGIDLKLIIGFLKEYVVYHFNAEEDYQQSISYCDMERHKELHNRFAKTVLEYEKRLIASDYDIEVVRELGEMLTAWLISHIANIDQKIPENLPIE